MHSRFDPIYMVVVTDKAAAQPWPCFEPAFGPEIKESQPVR
jgi:hypothetical protein